MVQASYFRKGLEAYFTVLIEACWPKRRILEIYLNIAEFGLWRLWRRGRGAALLSYLCRQADAQRLSGARGGVAQPRAADRRRALGGTFSRGAIQL